MIEFLAPDVRPSVCGKLEIKERAFGLGCCFKIQIDRLLQFNRETSDSLFKKKKIIRNIINSKIFEISIEFSRSILLNPDIANPSNIEDRLIDWKFLVFEIRGGRMEGEEKLAISGCGLRNRHRPRSHPVATFESVSMAADGRGKADSQRKGGPPSFCAPSQYEMNAPFVPLLPEAFNLRVYRSGSSNLASSPKKTDERSKSSSAFCQVWIENWIANETPVFCLESSNRSAFENHRRISAASKFSRPRKCREGKTGIIVCWDLDGNFFASRSGE